MSDINYKDKTSRVFNKFFSSFLRDLKEIDDTLRVAVKASYKVIDKASSEYCDFFKEQTLPHMSKFVQESECLEGDVLEVQVCKGLQLGTVLEKLQGDERKQERNIIMNYLYILLLFAHMNSLDNENELFVQVVRILGYIQANNDEQYNSEKDDIIDDDIKVILGKIKSYEAQPKVDIKKESEAESSDMFSILGNSKIADLAKEISEGIDVSSLKTENPDDLIKNMLDFSSGNNVLGNIIQKVSSTLNNKISSGELKHDELLGEAMSMMNIFNDGKNPLASNPLFSQMMKSMKTGKTAMKQDVVRKSDARDRLRKKLEMRKKNVE